MLRHAGSSALERPLLIVIVIVILISLFRGLFQRGPDSMHIIMVFKTLKKLAHLRALWFGELRVAFRDISDLAGNDVPTVLRKPLRY